MTLTEVWSPCLGRLLDSPSSRSKTDKHIAMFDTGKSENSALIQVTQFQWQICMNTSVCFCAHIESNSLSIYRRVKYLEKYLEQKQRRTNKHILLCQNITKDNTPILLLTRPYNSIDLFSEVISHKSDHRLLSTFYIVIMRFFFIFKHKDWPFSYLYNVSMHRMLWIRDVHSYFNHIPVLTLWKHFDTENFNILIFMNMI